MEKIEEFVITYDKNNPQVEQQSTKENTINNDKEFKIRKELDKEIYKMPIKSFETRWKWSIIPWLIYIIVTTVWAFLASVAVATNSPSETLLYFHIPLAIWTSTVFIINLANQINLTKKLTSKKYEDPPCGISIKISMCLFTFSIIESAILFKALQGWWRIIAVVLLFTAMLSLIFMLIRGIIRIFKKTTSKMRIKFNKIY